MDKILGKFVWNTETCEFTEVSGCLKEETDLERLKNLFYDCVLDAGMITGSDISGDTKLRRIILSYQHFEYVIVLEKATMSVVKRQL